MTCNRANLQIDKCQLLSEQILYRCLKQDPVSKVKTDDLCWDQAGAVMVASV